MKRKSVIAVAILAVTAALGGYYYWTGTPKYALNQAAKSARAHDLPTFEKYVDIEGVSRDFVDGFMVATSKEMDSQLAKNPFAGMATGMIQMMKPRMIDDTKAEIRKAVQTGKFEDIQKKAAGGGDANKPAKEFEIRYVKRDGSAALVGISPEDSKDGDPVIKLKLNDVGHHWRVTGVDMSEVFK